jgi:hypothetical protein
MRRGACDPVALARRDRLAGARVIAARLHLDRRQGAAAPREDIDLAHSDAVVAGEDAIAFEAQRPETKTLGPAAAPLGLAPTLRARAHSGSAAARLPCKASARA